MGNIIKMACTTHSSIFCNKLDQYSLKAPKSWFPFVLKEMDHENRFAKKLKYEKVKVEL